MIERCDHTDRAQVREACEAGDGAFVAVDPGNDGGALVCARGGTVLAYVEPYDDDALAAAMLKYSAGVLVVESQYVTSLKRARSIVELTFRTGLLLGVVSERIPSLYIFDVAPSTWQAFQRGGGKATRGEGIVIARREAERVLGVRRWFADASVARKEGISSALGIAQWWRHVMIQSGARAS